MTVDSLTEDALETALKAMLIEAQKIGKPFHMVPTHVHVPYCYTCERYHLMPCIRIYVDWRAIHSTSLDFSGTKE